MSVKGILVGNAASLLGGFYGPFIDRFEIVIRMNGGRPKDNIGSIGSMTTHWSVSAPNDEIYSDWKIPGAIPWHLNRRISYPCCGVSNPVDNYRKLINDYGYERPSTGLITAHYAINVEHIELSLIGFDFNESGAWYCLDRTTDPHDWEREKEYVNNMDVKIL